MAEGQGVGDFLLFVAPKEREIWPKSKHPFDRRNPEAAGLFEKDGSCIGFR